MKESNKLHIDILSDGTGETALAVLRACLVQYDREDIVIKRHPNIRTKEQIESCIKQVKNDRYIILYTLVLEETRQIIKGLCEQHKIKCIDLLHDLITNLDSFLDHSKTKEPGLLRTVNRDYFKRIEAMEYSLKHDDGQLPEHFDQADIVLVGVSRTSKTPLSIFLSYKGWKVANVPMVHNIKPPENLFKIDQRKIVALTISPDYLFKIRRNRLEKFNIDTSSNYANQKEVYEEVFEMQSLFQTHKWPCLNVTEIALEETASEIIRIISKRQNIPIKII